MKTLLKYLLLCSIGLLPLAAQPHTFNFSAPVVIGPVQAPGIWYTDRYPPNGFVSPSTAPDGSPNALKESINAADSNTGRPVAFASGFYSTQGRKFDLPPNTLSMTIALYVPASWATEPARKAGFWGTVFDTTNLVGDFPIIEFQGPLTAPPVNGPNNFIPNGGVAGFYGWNNTGAGSWDLIPFPTGFTYNSWVQLTITFVPGTGFIYTVGDKSITSPLSTLNDAYIGNVILQGYNYAATYDIFWKGADVPGSFQLRYFTNLNLGDSFIDISNDGSAITSAAVGGTTVNFSTGNICVNVYAFDPAEEMVSCCACMLTPNGLASLSVQSDVLGNTLTSASPTSLTVKLLASAPSISGQNPFSAVQSCNPTLANGLNPGIPSFVPAMHAWATTLHATPGGVKATETAFSKAPLGTASAVGMNATASELQRLLNNCSFILSNGSGFGVCKICRNGGLGAARQ